MRRRVILHRLGVCAAIGGTATLSGLLAVREDHDGDGTDAETVGDAGSDDDNDAGSDEGDTKKRWVAMVRSEKTAVTAWMTTVRGPETKRSTPPLRPKAGVPATVPSRTPSRSTPPAVAVRSVAVARCRDGRDRSR